MKFRFVTILFLLASVIMSSILYMEHDAGGSASRAQPDGVVAAGEYPNHAAFDNGSFEAYWDTAGGTLSMAMVGRTPGWVAIGLNASDRHQGADMVFGWVDTTGTATVLDCYNPGALPPHPEDTAQGGTFDIDSYGGTESGGVTTIEFTRALVTGDVLDFDYPVNSTVYVIWALGEDDEVENGSDDDGGEGGEVEPEHEKAGYGTLGHAPPAPGIPDTLDGAVSAGEYSDHASFGGGNLEIYWNVSGGKIAMALAGRTPGWVSIGFNGTDLHKGADMVFGWVEAGGNAMIMDSYNPGRMPPHPEDTAQGGTFDILSYGAAESAGVTTIEFTRYLVTGDALDFALPESGSVNIIWALGSGDDPAQKHASAGYGAITIRDTGPPGPGPPVPVPTLDGIVSPGEYRNNATFGGGDVNVQWSVASGMLNMAIVGRTAGWVAIGFNSTDLHKGADMIFGWVDGSGGANVMDSYNPGTMPPHPEDTAQGGTFDIHTYGGSESGGVTTIEFTRALVTGDVLDFEFPRNNSVSIIWAIGSGDDPGQKHASAGYGTLPPAQAGPPANETPRPQPTLDGVVLSGEYLNHASLDGGNFDVYWCDKCGVLRMALVGRTTGWVALGFNSTDLHTGADMIIGWVDGSGRASIMDAFNPGRMPPHPNDTAQGGTFDILSFGGTESGGVTTIEFTRALATGDGLDFPYPKGENVSVIWSMGASDDPAQKHASAGYATLVPAATGPPLPGPDMDGTVSPGEYQGHASFGDGSFVLYWSIANGKVNMAMVGRTAGWVAVGFNGSDIHMGADMIFGSVDGNGVAMVMDCFNPGRMPPHPNDTAQGGTFDILSYGATQSGNLTTVEFARLMSTGDPYDFAFPSNGSLDIIWSLGKSDAVTGKHASAGYGSIDITPAGPVPSDPGPTLDGTISAGEYAHSASVGAGAFAVHWSIAGSKLRMALVGRTAGWVSIGFNSTDVHKGADMIFGWVDAGGRAGIMDCYNPGKMPPHPNDTAQGGTFDILAYGGTEAGGFTTVEFVRNLTTLDGLDADLSGGGTVDIIWAIGPSDQWNKKHSEAGFGTLDLHTGKSTQKNLDWELHAILGTLCFLLLLGIIATGAMMTGGLKGPKGLNVLFAHKMISTLFALAAVASLLYGLWVTNQYHSDYFISFHGWLGLAIAIAALLQVVPSYVIKKRRYLKFPHMLLGYLLVLLVLVETQTGLQMALFGEVKVPVLLHSVAGGMAGLAMIWLIVQILFLKEKGLQRAKNTAYTGAFFNVVGCWLMGGFNYILDYGKNVKPVILSGSQPWAHRVLMETKEHIFLFLPVLSLTLAVVMFTLVKDDSLLKDKKSRSGVILLAAFILLMVVLMFVMGVIISDAGSLRGY